MGCAASQDITFDASQEIQKCDECEAPLTISTGSWTPIAALDFSTPTTRKEAATSIESINSYVDALAVLAMLPGLGDMKLGCTRTVHGLAFGPAKDAVVFELSEAPFEGFLALTRKYLEHRAAVEASSSSMSTLAPVLRRACVLAEDAEASHETNRHAVIILLKSAIDVAAFEETAAAVKAAEKQGLAVICLGMGNGELGSFLEETLPAMSPCFKFFGFATLSESHGVAATQGRSHCARRITKGVMDALRRPSNESERLIWELASRRCGKFCISCGRLPSSTNLLVSCELCGAKEKVKERFSTPETADASSPDCRSLTYSSEESNTDDMASV